MPAALDPPPCRPLAAKQVKRVGRDDDHGLVRELSDIGPDDAALVGGKAFHLGALIRHGFDVPRGFCITTNVFRQACREDHVAPALPPSLRATIVAAWRRAGIKAAAVRSSASEEDGSKASWAGIFPTVLPVRDEDEMISAVEACFRALNAPGAVAYRRSRPLASSRPAMAVIVQDLVDARAAGMVFSANPVTGAADEVVINAVPGLCEPLASGHVTGDVFVTTRAGELKAVSLSNKRSMLTGAGPLALAPAMAECATLSEREAGEIARLAVRVEAMLGCPQDIEFAISGSRIFLIQARPITGRDVDPSISEAELEAFLEAERAKISARVLDLRRQGLLHEPHAIFSRGNVGELLPTPTPMSFGLFRTIFAGHGGAIVTGRRRLGYKLDDALTEPLFEQICGQPYFNVEVDAKTFDIGLPVDVASILERIAADPARANYPEFGLYTQSLSLNEAVSIHGARQGQKQHDALWRFHAAMTQAAHDMLRRYPREIEPSLLRCLDRPCPKAMAGSDAALLAQFQRRLEHLRNHACVSFVMAARLAFYFADMVRWRLEHYLGDARLAAPLLQGLDGSAVTGQAFALEDLAHGRITHEAFLNSYGHGAANELEISLPRLSEEARAIEPLLQDMAASNRSPAQEFREQQCRRLSVQRDVRQLFESHGIGEQQIAAFFADLHLAQTFLPLRETIKHFYTGDYRALRLILLEMNRRLGWADGDIFYLEPEEVDGGLCAADALVPIVQRRRRERRMSALLAAQRRLPDVIFSNALHAIGARHKGAPRADLKGIPVAPGVAVGRVRFLDDAALRSSSGKNMGGEQIIVAHSANLGLAPLMRVAAGLIVEVGGILAHAACQARESGIPAVVLSGATGLLREGMTIRVDGQSGLVEVLDAQGVL